VHGLDRAIYDKRWAHAAPTIEGAVALKREAQHDPSPTGSTTACS
jgi:hypothetical protein